MTPNPVRCPWAPIAWPCRSAATPPVPAVLFLHGAGGSGSGVLGMRRMVRDVTGRGYAVLAPDGLPWRPGRSGGIWSFLPASQREPVRDEAAFFAELVADASERYGIDPDRVLLAGFSAGGFMVTYLACAQPDAFPAYAPIAGGFWRPHPVECAGPVKLLHTHGFKDSTVPLEGRPLGGGQWLQGDISRGPRAVAKRKWVHGAGPGSVSGDRRVHAKGLVLRRRVPHLSLPSGAGGTQCRRDGRT